MSYRDKLLFFLAVFLEIRLVVSWIEREKLISGGITFISPRHFSVIRERGSPFFLLFFLAHSKSTFQNNVFLDNLVQNEFQHPRYYRYCPDVAYLHI